LGEEYGSRVSEIRGEEGRKIVATTCGLSSANVSSVITISLPTMRLSLKHQQTSR
jgi:hypothetical protein